MPNDNNNNNSDREKTQNAAYRLLKALGIFKTKNPNQSSLVETAKKVRSKNKAVDDILKEMDRRK